MGVAPEGFMPHITFLSVSSPDITWIASSPNPPASVLCAQGFFLPTQCTAHMGGYPFFTLLAAGSHAATALQALLSYAALPVLPHRLGTRSENQRREGEPGDPGCSNSRSDEGSSSRGEWGGSRAHRLTPWGCMQSAGHQLNNPAVWYLQVPSL